MAGGTGGSAKPRAATSERGTRLPEDWQPTEDLLVWFREKKLGEVELSAVVDLETEIETFRNHWLSKSGRDATKRAWGRTFQNWLVESARRSQRFARNGARASPTGPYRNPKNQDDYDDWTKKP